MLRFTNSLATKCISLNNERQIAGPRLIDLNPGEFHDYPLRCDISCNVAEDPFGRIYAPNKIEYVHLKLLNIPTEVNE